MQVNVIGHSSRCVKGVKAVGPDDTPVEVWKHRGDVAMELWTRLVNRIFMDQRGVHICGNYKELICHTTTVEELSKPDEEQK